MKHLIISLLLLFTIKSYSQIQDEIYVVDSYFSGYQFFSESCHKDSVDVICTKATFRVIDISNTEDIVKIKITSRIACEDYADYDGTYCVSKKAFTEKGSVHLKSADKKWTPSLGAGVLTVPFKFDRSTFKVYPAGEVGGIAGLKVSNIKSGLNIMIGGILGLSSIPLNDLNSVSANEIKTAAGVTVGGGISINVPNSGFQFGFYYGVDFYNTNNTKFQKDWLSFGIGYDFIKVNEVKKTAAAVPLPAI